MGGMRWMSRRAMYGWKSFWLGLFVLVFFSWAWRWSVANYETKTCGLGGNEYAQVYVGDGSFVILKMRTVPVTVPGLPVMMVLEDDVIGKEGWALLSGDRMNAGVLWVLAFPMWFPLACWGVVWTGWLVWRWRRMKGLTEVEGEG